MPGAAQPANPYATGINVAGTGPNNSSTNWGVSWNPTYNSYAANTGFGQAPVFQPSSFGNINLPQGYDWVGGTNSSLANQFGVPGSFSSTNLPSYLQIGTPGGGQQSVQYQVDPSTGYFAPYAAQGMNNQPSLGTNIMDTLIGGGAALGAGVAGAGALGLLGAGGTTAGAGAGDLSGAMLAGDLPASDVAGASGLGTLAGAPAASTPGLAGLGDVATAGGGAAAAGGGASFLGGASGDFTGGPIMSGLGSAAGNITPASLGGPATSGFDLGSLFTPGGANSLLNVQSLGGIGGTLYNIFNNPGSKLTQPYNTALGNAQPAINNLNQLLSAGPQGFYNTAVGQGLMASQLRNINAQQSAAGRFGIGTSPNGQGGITPNIPNNGQGVDALNLLNQYMAQQYNNTINSAAGAVNPMLGAINATYPGYNAGNIIGANQLAPLGTLFNNPAFNNAGNSALQYLWNGIG